MLNLKKKIRTRIHQLVRLLRFLSIRMAMNLKATACTKAKKKTANILFNITTEEVLKRYIFSLARCLQVSGATVRFQFHWRFLFRDHEPNDFALLLSPNIGFIYWPQRKRSASNDFQIHAVGKNQKANSNIASFTQLKLAPALPITNDAEYFVPLTIGPMYVHEHEKWVPSAESVATAAYEKRVIDVFFSGALKKPAYTSHHVLDSIGVYGRKMVVDWMLKNATTNGLEYFDDYGKSHGLLKSAARHHLVIVEAQTAGFSGMDYRQILLKSRFFLALPGIDSVHTHSMIEAICCGVVPIVQRSKQLHVEFQHGKTCLIFDSMQDLDAMLEESRTIAEAEWKEMSKNCRLLYEEKFSPEAIGRNALHAIRNGMSLAIIQA